MAASLAPACVRQLYRRKILLLLALTCSILSARALGLARPAGVNRSYPSICPFRAITGLPCPGCGMAHGIACTAAGRLDDAVRYNPFSPLVLAGAAVLWLALLHDVLLNRDLLEKTLRAARSPCLVLAALMLCWGAWRAIAALTEPTPTGSGNHSAQYRLLH